MSTNEFTDVPHTIGCEILQGIVCWRWLQSDGAICNRQAINHSILEGLATLIGSHLTREPISSPALTKCWNWELILSTNFGSLRRKVTNFGSQNFGYQIWFCTRLMIPHVCSAWNGWPWPGRSQNWMLMYFIINLSGSQQFSGSSIQNQVELSEWATGRFMHCVW